MVFGTALVVASLLQQVPTSVIVEAEPLFEEARSALLREVENAVVPSVAIGIAVDGRVLWLEAIGWADRERGIPATPGTIYAVGSLSKSVTATAVLALVSQAQLSLDDRASELLEPLDLGGPETFVERVNVGQLLNSTGGIAHGWVSFDDEGEAAARLPGRTALVAFPPGEVFEYSNHSFGVLQRLIEVKAETTFGDALARLVFDPLGMVGSKARFDPEHAHDFAAPYDSDGSSLRRRHNTPEGGLGLYSTAADLLSYGMYHAGQSPPDGNGPVSGDWLARMRETGAGPGQGFFHLGWWAGGGGSRVSNGSIRGANAHLRILPQPSAAIVVLTNQTGYFADEWAGRLAAVLAPSADQAGAESRGEYGRRFRTPYTKPDGWPLDWTGRLVTAGGDIAVSLTLGEDGPAVSLDGREAALLENASLNEFGELRGWFMGSIRGVSPDDSDPHRIQVVARRDDEQLRGYVSAVYSTETTGLSVPVRLELTAGD